MSILNSIPNKKNESGSALLLVIFMTILLAIVVAEVSFSSQTSFSLAQTQIDKFRMESAADTGFAYALNIVRSQKEVTIQSTEGTANDAGEEPAAEAVNASPFSQSAIDNNKVSAPIDDTIPPSPWNTGLPSISINNINLKMTISLEEGKININRLVDEDDKVDMRIRNALLVLFEKFNGTEDDINRIIDFIDKNQLGNFETRAKNGPASSLSEILKIEGLTLTFTEKSQLEIEGSLDTTDQPSIDGKAEITLADYITVKSVGRLNINYALADTVKALLNGNNEASLAGAIVEQRTAQPFKSLNDLSIDKNFKSGFLKLANYITTNESTFKVNLLLKAKSNDAVNCYLGYIFKSGNQSFYIYRTERFASDDIEFKHIQKLLDSSEDAESVEVAE